MVEKIKNKIKDIVDTAKFIYKGETSYLDNLTLQEANNVNAMNITINQALIFASISLQFAESPLGKIILVLSLLGASYQGWQLSRYLSAIKTKGT